MELEERNEHKCASSKGLFQTQTLKVAEARVQHLHQYQQCNEDLPSRPTQSILLLSLNKIVTSFRCYQPIKILKY